MKNIKLILIAFLSMVMNMNAQTENTQNISLKQAIEIGLKNRSDIRANKINIELANNSVSKNKKEWLPSIEASSIVKYNTQLQQMIFPNGFNGTGSSETITMGTKNQTTFSFDFSQSIYKSGLNTDIKIAKNDALLEFEKNKEKEISIKLQIGEAYLNTILKNKQLNLSNDTKDRYFKYYTIAQDKHRLKVILENDLLKAKLDYENAKITSLEANQNYDLAIRNLKYQLNIDDNLQIFLTDSIESFQKEYEFYNFKATNSMNQRTELKQLSLEYNTNKLKLLKNSQYFIPTISLIANYSTQFQSENFNYSQNLWSPFNSVGLKVSIPITGNFKNNNSILENKLKMEQIKFQLEQKQHDIDYEIEKYKTELINAQNEITISYNNYNISKQLNETQINTFQLGTTSYSGILDMQNSLNTAQQNYVKAVYNFLVAKINYEKAIDKL